MTLTLKELTKDLTNIDIDDILSCWQWKISGMKAVALMTVLGDLFLIAEDDTIHWFQTDEGELTKVANNLQEFEQCLDDEDKVDYWFLPLVVEKLISSGKTLKENEVYSCVKPPIIGGEYTVENIKPISISAHFAYDGWFCEQIKDLPDGTKVNIKVKL